MAHAAVASAVAQKKQEALKSLIEFNLIKSQDHIQKGNHV